MTNLSIELIRLSESGENSGGPEDFAAECGYEEEAAHPLAEALLQGVQHGDVALLAHPVSEEDAAWESKTRSHEALSVIMQKVSKKQESHERFTV